MLLADYLTMDAFQWRKWFLIFIIMLSRRLDTVEALKCYCNSEACPNNTCVTDGYCYATTSIENGVQKFTYQCWDRKQFFPPGDRPIWCREAEHPDIKCCSTDYCNRDIFPGTDLRMCRQPSCRLGSLL
ncbi:unnamed protein product [Diatraea saccharalis]|uniref:Activin types I and II receptor domain-containing protein n=1 Tax=Diatraea saccharalis TaxID=40085 RepID=A0A9N9N1D4_9NEOP|nr:unnamed protein product [Diatraea saccharalis]